MLVVKDTGPEIKEKIKELEDTFILWLFPLSPDQKAKFTSS